jgi:histidine triad (HIT) family protein
VSRSPSPEFVRGSGAYYSNAVTDCVFCRIVARQSTADIEYEDDDVLAFKDIYPKAPVHILIVPKRHIASIMAVQPSDATVLGRCLIAARKIGEQTGFAEKGYRVTVNCGPEAGQVVYHVHFHFLAGRRR